VPLIFPYKLGLSIYERRGTGDVFSVDDWKNCFLKELKEQCDFCFNLESGQVLHNHQIIGSFALFTNEEVRNYRSKMNNVPLDLNECKFLGKTAWLDRTQFDRYL